MHILFFTHESKRWARERASRTQWRLARRFFIVKQLRQNEMIFFFLLFSSFSFFHDFVCYLHLLFWHYWTTEHNNSFIVSFHGILLNHFSVYHFQVKFSSVVSFSFLHLWQLETFYNSFPSIALGYFDNINIGRSVGFYEMTFVALPVARFVLACPMGNRRLKEIL